jgi:hypothetical protein
MKLTLPKKHLLLDLQNSLYYQSAAFCALQESDLKRNY